MSAAAEGSGSTTKALAQENNSSSALKDQQKPAAALEEDDEFEDFPVEGRSLKDLWTFTLTFYGPRLAARRCRGTGGAEYAPVGRELG